MIGRRCDKCEIDWPNLANYCECPKCGEETTAYEGLIPLSIEDAEHAVLHLKFEEYYRQYCLKKGQPIEGVLR